MSASLHAEAVADDELPRAVRLDVLANRAAVLVGTGDLLGAEAAALDYEAAVDGGREASDPRAARLLATSAEATGAFTSMLTAVTALPGADELTALQLRESAAAAHAKLLESDPAYSWERPVYSRRMPWGEEGRAEVARRLAVLGLDGAGSEAPAKLDPLGRIAGAYERWRAQAEPGEAGAGALRELADATAASLRPQAQDALARQALWPDPLIEHHWTALTAALDAARTPIDVALVADHADACLAIEGDWNRLALTTLLAPLLAASRETRCQAPCFTRGGDVAAAHALAGVGPRAALALPRVAELTRAALALGFAPAIGAYRGEAGFELVTEAPGWHEPPEDAPEPPALPRPLTLWGETFEPAEMHVAVARPARPKALAFAEPAGL